MDAYMADYPPVIDLQSDAEDEAMVELAIALSLQEQAGGAALAIQGIQEGLQALEEMHQEVMDVAEALSPPGEEEGEGEDEGRELVQGGGGQYDHDHISLSNFNSDMIFFDYFPTFQFVCNRIRCNCIPTSLR